MASTSGYLSKPRKLDNLLYDFDNPRSYPIYSFKWKAMQWASSMQHISESEMKSFHSGNLPARDTIICAEHLEVCHACSRLFHEVSNHGVRQKLPALDISSTSILAGKHLSYEQISDYLDDYLEKNTKQT